MNTVQSFQWINRREKKPEAASHVRNNVKFMGGGGIEQTLPLILPDHPQETECHLCHTCL